MNRTRWTISFAALLALVFLVGCGSAEKKDSDKLSIVTTVGMIADAAAIIGGEHVEVTGLMGPGVDPHLYKASEGDVARMAGADIILYGGLHLEGKMGEVFERMQTRIPTVAVGESIPVERRLRVAGKKGNVQYDPHIWFDVSLWMLVTDRIAETLAEQDSANAAYYQANAAAYRDSLQVLHDWVLERTALVPEDKRVLITAHDAFTYFSRAYGFEVRGLQGISTATEAGTGDVIKFADFIAKQQIPAIFVESSVPPRTIEAVQAAVRSRGFDVQIGGELFSDAMGNTGTPEGHYLGMVRHNVNTIVDALTGKASVELATEDSDITHE
ncbi:zinc ABC transporter substrate-binding protein [bacterium]|nr:zinc ABC transporter substrate-binding protein [bacterium]